MHRGSVRREYSEEHPKNFFKCLFIYLFLVWRMGFVAL